VPPELPELVQILEIGKISPANTAILAGEHLPQIQLLAESSRLPMQKDWPAHQPLRHQMAARNVNLAIKKFRSARPLESSARAPAEFEKFVVD
jgi:hypothetical protein